MVTKYYLKETQVATREVKRENLTVRTFKLYEVKAKTEAEATALREAQKGLSIARCWIFQKEQGDPERNIPDRFRLHLCFYFKAKRKKDTAERVAIGLELDYLQENQKIIRPVSEFRLFDE